MLLEWSTLISAVSATISAISTVAYLWVTWKLFCEERTSSNRFYLDSRTPNIVVTSAESYFHVSVPHLPEFVIDSIEATIDDRIKCNSSSCFKVTDIECHLSIKVNLHNYSSCGGKVLCNLLRAGNVDANNDSVSKTIATDATIEFDIKKRFASADDFTAYAAHPSSQILMEVTGFGLSAKDTIIIEVENTSKTLSCLPSEARLHYNKYHRTYAHT